MKGKTMWKTKFKMKTKKVWQLLFVFFLSFLTRLFCLMIYLDVDEKEEDGLQPDTSGQHSFVVAFSFFVSSHQLHVSWLFLSLTVVSVLEELEDFKPDELEILQQGH